MFAMFMLLITGLSVIFYSETIDMYTHFLSSPNRAVMILYLFFQTAVSIVSCVMVLITRYRQKSSGLVLPFLFGYVGWSEE